MSDFRSLAGHALFQLVGWFSLTSGHWVDMLYFNWLVQLNFGSSARHAVFQLVDSPNFSVIGWTCCISIGWFSLTSGSFAGHAVFQLVDSPKFPVIGWTIKWICCISIGCFSFTSGHWLDMLHVYFNWLL